MASGFWGASEFSILSDRAIISEAPSTVLISGSLTEPIDTSSAIPTSTGIVEPPGRAVIFLIEETTDNQKRDINKRATGGFVGADNPEPLGSQGDGALPQGAITKTFATFGRKLVFRNSALPSGQAGFCQDASGETYITFTSSPPGCIPVILGVYDGEDNSDAFANIHTNYDRVEQCQNGRLVGVETSTSSLAVSSEASAIVTASFGSVSSEESTIAAPTISTVSNPLSSTEPSDNPSDTGSRISTTASSRFFYSSITIESLITSTAEVSTEITSIASESSTSKSSLELASSVSSGTFGEIIPTTTAIVSESSLETAESTIETDATSSKPVETLTSLMSTSGEPASESSTAGETTTTVPTFGITESSTETTVPDTLGIKQDISASTLEADKSYKLSIWYTLLSSTCSGPRLSCGAGWETFYPPARLVQGAGYSQAEVTCSWTQEQLHDGPFIKIEGSCFNLEMIIDDVVLEEVV
ncbi:unnamed protein product [Fusarium equiseti]|uniref:DUF7908 domain-containing protein n=1 Tax=Fusarium equiseti TaxID=61235 RepID=A0A8J2JIM3_FUSEQ|nr:unnamed protein product [Fusarium equiseti]